MIVAGIDPIRVHRRAVYPDHQRIPSDIDATASPLAELGYGDEHRHLHAGSAEGCGPGGAIMPGGRTTRSSLSMRWLVVDNSGTSQRAGFRANALASCGTSETPRTNMTFARNTAVHRRARRLLFPGLLPAASLQWLVARQGALHYAWRMLAGLGKLLWMERFRQTHGEALLSPMAWL